MQTVKLRIRSEIALQAVSACSDAHQRLPVSIASDWPPVDSRLNKAVGEQAWSTATTASTCAAVWQPASQRTE